MANIYMAGLTQSPTGIATVGAFQTVYGGVYHDAFLAKYSNGGSLLWSTYYGDKQDDYANAVTTDRTGSVYIVGYTNSTSGIATAGAYKTSFAGDQDAFVVKFNTSGARQWATYYGDTGIEIGNAIVVDTYKNVYISGYTNSHNNIASSTADQTSYGGGLFDAFLLKLE